MANVFTDLDMRTSMGTDLVKRTYKNAVVFGGLVALVVAGYYVVTAIQVLVATVPITLGTAPSWLPANVVMRQVDSEVNMYAIGAMILYPLGVLGCFYFGVAIARLLAEFLISIYRLNEQATVSEKA